MSNVLLLPANSNQVLGLAEYARRFLLAGTPYGAVLDRALLLHTDSALTGLSALACKCPAPRVLRREALRYRCRSADGGVPLFGDSTGALVHPEKAALAGGAAVREWDSNGTNFGYKAGDPRQQAGEFGHIDYYPAIVAACQATGRDGAYALRAMVLVDEIRDALARVYSLKTYKIDHVLHGGIAVAVTVGVIYNLSSEQIESAVGQVVAHHLPTRAIRFGHQLSDSKGSSAAIITEAAYLAVLRARDGFIGPKDIFRNPEGAFWLMLRLGGTKVVQDQSPFDLELATAGDQFAVMGMHFKLGVYEHQSAGAIQALIRLLQKHPELAAKLRGGQIRNINVKIYGVAHHIISDPHKWEPETRQSADHSMPYILAIVLRRAIQMAEGNFGWETLMPLPEHYGVEWLRNAALRSLMPLITCEHEASYDARYPDGIPTSVVITDSTGATFDSGLVMYPGGHARNHLGDDRVDLASVLGAKHEHLAGLASHDPSALLERLNSLPALDAADLRQLYAVRLRDDLPPIDG